MSQNYSKYFLFLFSCLFFPLVSNAQLTLEVTDIEKISGSVFIAIYDSEATFMDTENAVYRSMEKVEQQTLSHVMNDLPPGQYAIAIFHDENDNQELDTGLFGIPKEGYGFSNDARGKFGPPSFSDARFEVVAGKNNVAKITLR